MSDLIELAKQQATEIACAGHNGWGNTMLELADALEAAREDAERLAKALLRYGRHEHNCDQRHDSAYKPRPACTCGLEMHIDQARGRGIVPEQGEG